MNGRGGGAENPVCPPNVANITLFGVLMLKLLNREHLPLNNI